MVNIGGYHYFRRHWRILDNPSDHYSFKLGVLDYEHDLTDPKPFPLKDNSVSFFYTAHTIEHIPQEFCEHVFDEIYRCLKPGGAIRLTMPDFDLAYEAYGKYLKNNELDVDFLKQDYPEKTLEGQFLHFFASYLGDKESPEDVRNNYLNMKKEEFADYYTKKIPRESQKEFTGKHINWWNYEKLSNMLKNAKFTTVYRSNIQESKFNELQGEGRDCGFDSTRPEISLFVGFLIVKVVVIRSPAVKCPPNQLVIGREWEGSLNCLNPTAV